MSENGEVKKLSIEERLYANETRPGQESHLSISDPALCVECPKPCVKVCPAHTYSFSAEQGRILITHENCLECGGCRAFCPHSVIAWRNPFGGRGICYRYG